MIKTEKRIESDFYCIVKDSVLGQSLRGKVYRSDKRPPNSKEEDAVVRFLSGRVNGVLQDGVVVVNVYVPSVIVGGEPLQDDARIEELEDLISEMLWEDSSEYEIETDGDPSTTKHEEIDQHCICVRLAYSRVAG